MAMMEKDLSPDDFKETKTNWIKCCRGTITEFEWKDYCPTVFRNILEIQNINYTEYMLIVCGEDILRRVVSPGKSGTVFLSSRDDRFVIKILRKCEKKVLFDMLPDYYRHIQTQKSSLLCKIYGLHHVRISGGIKVYFAVMSNYLKSDLPIDLTYDLKGSSKGRNSIKAVFEEDTIRKDADFNFCFYIDPLIRHQLLRQIKYDCQFLEVQGVMDYSILLGMHIEKQYEVNGGSTVKGRSSVSGISSISGRDSISGRRSTYRRGGSVNGRKSISSKIDMSNDTSDGNDNTDLPFSFCPSQKNSLGHGWDDSIDYKIGIRVPAHAIQTSKKPGGSVSSHWKVQAEEHYNVILSFSIVDLFQNYSMVKRIEHVYKSIQYDSKSIAAVNPKAYSARFQEFSSRIFQAKDSLSLHLIEKYAQKMKAPTMDHLLKHEGILQKDWN